MSGAWCNSVLRQPSVANGNNSFLSGSRCTSFPMQNHGCPTDLDCSIAAGRSKPAPYYSHPAQVTGMYGKPCVIGAIPAKAAACYCANGGMAAPPVAGIIPPCVMSASPSGQEDEDPLPGQYGPCSSSGSSWRGLLPKLGCSWQRRSQEQQQRQGQVGAEHHNRPLPMADNAVAAAGAAAALVTSAASDAAAAATPATAAGRAICGRERNGCQIPRTNIRRRVACGCGGSAVLRHLQQLLLPLLMAVAALQGASFPGGSRAAAAVWPPWLWGKSIAPSAAVGGSTKSSGGDWQLGGHLPYSWRTHGDDAAASGGSSTGSSGSSSNKSSKSSSKTRPAGKGSKDTSDERVSVVFGAGSVPVLVNAAGNATALLAYDLYKEPPSPLPLQNAKKRPNSKGELSDAQLALRELLTSGRLPYDPMKPYKRPAVSYENSDFVFATGSYPSRYLLAQSTRSWRRGIRAFIAVNNTEDLELLNAQNKVHNERYEYFPDDGTEELGPVYHGCMAGDTRAAMAPFLAHQYFGETYKWLLYGDDDTLFYMPSVKRLLAHMDPELPLAISDNLWFRSRHPNLLAPRCLPCHLAVDADPPPPSPPAAAEAAGAGKAAGATIPAPKVIRIPNITTVMEGYMRFILGIRTIAELQSPKVQKLLNKNTFSDFNKSLFAIAHLPPDASVPGVRYIPRPACPFCTAEATCTPTPPSKVNVTGAGCFASGGHGGAGMIFSVGLLRRLSPERMKRCYMKIIMAPGGDGMLSACLWEAGYAFTDPGASTLARYDGNYLLFSSEAGKWALHDPLAVLMRGKCDGRCKWLLRNAASHHGRGRHFQSFQQSAAYLYGNTASYTAAHKWLAFMAGRDGDLAELEEIAKAAGPGSDGGV